VLREASSGFCFQYHPRRDLARGVVEACVSAAPKTSSRKKITGVITTPRINMHHATRVRLIYNGRSFEIVAFRLQVVFDCRDPAKLSEFYARALHYKLQDPPSGYPSWEAWLKEQGIPEAEWNSASAIVDPEGKGPRVYFQQMYTPKLGKNRLHIDINASGGLKVPLPERKRQVNQEDERLWVLGATTDHELEEMGEYCFIMLDPEGNEFCVQ